MAVAASHAALLLAQGSGRLLRRVTDRGVVAVLDSRMATAGYGGYLACLAAAVLADHQRRTGPRSAGAAARALDGPVDLRRLGGRGGIAGVKPGSNEAQLIAGSKHRMTGQHTHGVSDRAGQRQRRRRREDLVAALGSAGVRHLDGDRIQQHVARHRPCPLPPEPPPRRRPTRPGPRSRSTSASTPARDCPAGRCCRHR